MLTIDLTRSRRYRKNDQARVEQKNGAVVRKLLGYRRLQGVAGAQAITRLHGASHLFVNFFQPSFQLAEKRRQGAHVSKRYHPPQTPCERLLQTESLPESAPVKPREGVRPGPTEALGGDTRGSGASGDASRWTPPSQPNTRTPDLRIVLFRTAKYLLPLEPTRNETNCRSHGGSRQLRRHTSKLFSQRKQKAAKP